MEILLGMFAFLGIVGSVVLAASLVHHIKRERELEGRVAQLNSEMQLIRGQAEEVQTKLNEQEVTVLEARALTNRYGKVADAEQEVRRLQAQANEAKARFEKVVRELNASTRRLNAVQEDLETIDAGLYKPHFEWNDSQKYRLALNAVYARQKDMVKQDAAAYCAKSWTVEGDNREGERLTKDLKKLALRAFNAECEAAIEIVSWDNFEKMRSRIESAFEAINKLVSRWSLSLTEQYKQLWIEELILTHEYEEQKEKEREQQRRINEQIREEEKAQRELEKARRDAEAEEERTAAALERARREMETARAEDAEIFATKIAELEAALAAAHAEKERTQAMAELTKAGHVYIISNIGSFGERMLKIGMTRRLDPMDRVRELSDASVPFSFDVHGMIYTENAPKLESELHDYFADRRVNLVNDRKEFFHVTIAEVVEATEKLGLKVELTMLAEAKEFRQSESMRNRPMDSAMVDQAFSLNKNRE